MRTANSESASLASLQPSDRRYVIATNSSIDARQKKQPSDVMAGLKNALMMAAGMQTGSLISSLLTAAGVSVAGMSLGTAFIVASPVVAAGAAAFLFYASRKKGNIAGIGIIGIPPQALVGSFAIKGSIKEGDVFVLHPFDCMRYLRIENYNETLVDEQQMELTRLLRSVGARKITLKCKEVIDKKSTVAAGGKLTINNGTAKVDIKLVDAKSYAFSVEFGQEGHGGADYEPALYFADDPLWTTIKSMRDVKKLNRSINKKLDEALSLQVAATLASFGFSVGLELSSVSAFEWDLDVEF